MKNDEKLMNLKTFDLSSHNFVSCYELWSLN